MNIKIKPSIILFLIIFMFIGVINARAITVTTGDETGAYSATMPYKSTKIDGNNEAVYCSEFYKKRPTSSTICSEDNTWNKASKDAVAIGWIINSSQGDNDYAKKEILINAYLGKYGCGGNGCTYTSNLPNVPVCARTGFSNNLSSSCQYIEINDPNNHIGKMLTDPGHAIDYANNYANNYAKSKKLGISMTNFNYAGEKYESHVTVSNATDANYAISYSNIDGLTCEIKNKTTTGFDISCSYSGTQSSVSLSVYVYYGSKKYDTSKRYDCGADYQKIFTSESITTSTEVSASKTINTLEQMCRNDIQNKNPANLVSTYFKYKGYGRDWRKILDFTNPKCEGFETNVSSTKACSSTSVKVNNFNENNLSGYTETVKIGGINALCAVDFELDTGFLTTNEDIKSVVKSGRIIFGSLTNLGTATLTKTCYAFDVPDNDTTKTLNLEYEKYITDFKILRETLQTPKNLEPSYKRDKNKFTEEYTVNYFKTNYIKKISGLKGNKACFEKNACIEGPGLNTKFNYNGTIKFFPEVTYDEDFAKLFTTTTGDQCVLVFDQEIIKTNKKNNNEDDYKLNLEFRIIDTKKPFPGISGTGRAIGENWCNKSTNCTSVGVEDYTTISEDITNKIINAPNSDSTNPKYVIELDAKKISDIREYNKNHNYNEYNVTCKTDGECRNEFLSLFGIEKIEG